MRKYSFKNQKGTSLLFVILVLGIILAMALGISHFMSRQIGMLRDIGNSVKSFYIADAGIERLLEYQHIPAGQTFLWGGYYTLFCECVSGGNCPNGCQAASPQCRAPNYCLKSTGNYSDFSQVIFIDY